MSHFMDSDPLHWRVVTGLAKIGLALRTQQWQATGQRGLNPTQGQILTILRARPDGVSLAELAGELGVKPATASASVTALVRKRLVGKRPLPKNRRAVVIRLTASGSARGRSLGRVARHAVSRRLISSASTSRRSCWWRS